MSNVIVLNADNTYIGAISWQKSIILLCKGKVEVVKSTDRVITNVTKTVEFVIPKVVRLIKFVKNLYKTSNVPYSKRAVFIRDSHICQYCGVQMERKDCTVDHVYPKSLGGETSWENCVTACIDCNNIKGDAPYVGKTLVVKDAEGKEHHFHLRKKPRRPTVSDFIKMKTLTDIFDDL